MTYHALLTARQVADLLQVSLRSAYRYAANGTIPARKIGGSLRFHRADLAALLDADPRQARQQPAQAA